MKKIFIFRQLLKKGAKPLQHSLSTTAEQYASLLLRILTKFLCLFQYANLWTSETRCESSRSCVDAAWSRVTWTSFSWSMSPPATSQTSASHCCERSLDMLQFTGNTRIIEISIMAWGFAAKLCKVDFFFECRTWKSFVSFKVS